MSEFKFEDKFNTDVLEPEPSQPAPSVPSQEAQTQTIPLYSTLEQTQQATPKPDQTTPTASSSSLNGQSGYSATGEDSQTTVEEKSGSSYVNGVNSSPFYVNGERQSSPTFYTTGNSYTSAPYAANPGYINPRPMNQYSPYPMQSMPYIQAPKKKKEKKEKRRFGLGQMIAVAVVSALFCGVISGAVVATRFSAAGPAVSEESGEGTSTVKTVNISETADNVVAAVAEKASPSVVGIRVTTTSQSNFFGSSDNVGEGSGVVYTKDGYIITNYHVVSRAITSGRNPFFGKGLNKAAIEVFLPNDSETGIAATVIGYDETADLAVLKIEKANLTPVELGDSDALKIGDTAIAIGNPGGLEFMGSVSSGIISGLNRTLQTEGGIEMNLIQTDAAINPGNSGGALVNKEGRLIGINNSKMAGNGFEGMGFAIPVNQVKEITDRLIKNEGQPQSYLGVTIDSSYDADILKGLGYPAGAVVYSVAAGSPASVAGIQAYDIITKVNGKEISSYSQLTSEKNKYSVGETITLTIYRENQSFDVKVTLGEMQGQRQ